MNLEEKIYLDLMPNKMEYSDNDRGFPGNKTDITKIACYEEPDRSIRLLDKSISHIEEITNLLSSIAEITTLLVFKIGREVIEENKAEKGFLDIVTEVKELIFQSGKSISSISFEIENLQQNISETAIALKEVGKVLRHRSISTVNTELSDRPPVFY